MVAKEGSCPLLAIFNPNNLRDFKIIHISSEPTVLVDVFDGRKWKKKLNKNKTPPLQMLPQHSRALTPSLRGHRGGNFQAARVLLC